jgi:hypothetical protein
MQIDINPDSVMINKTLVARPSWISRYQWMAYWEAVKGRTHQNRLIHENA